MFGAEYDSEIINKVDELIRRAISDGLLVVPEEKKKELYTGPKFYYNDCYSRTIKVEYYKDGKLWKQIESVYGIPSDVKWKWIDDMEMLLQVEKIPKAVASWSTNPMSVEQFVKEVEKRADRDMALVAKHRGETEHTE